MAGWGLTTTVPAETEDPTGSLPLGEQRPGSSQREPSSLADLLLNLVKSWGAGQPAGLGPCPGDAYFICSEGSLPLQDFSEFLSQF